MVAPPTVLTRTGRLARGKDALPDARRDGAAGATEKADDAAMHAKTKTDLSIVFSDGLLPAGLSFKAADDVQRRRPPKECHCFNFSFE